MLNVFFKSMLPGASALEELLPEKRCCAVAIASKTSVLITSAATQASPEQLRAGERGL